MGELNSLLTEVKNNASELKEFFYNENIYDHPIPFKDLKIGSNFTMLLLCRAIRPQNLTLNMSLYVQRDLGKYYDQPLVTTI
jgi:hypothetical protein